MSSTAPFADELLTWWYARSSYARHTGIPRAPSRHKDPVIGGPPPDLEPVWQWLDTASVKFGISAEVLASHTMKHRYCALTPDQLTWQAGSLSDGGRRRSPTHLPRHAWCNRCLAEDFAAGRPAYIRQEWVIASVTFCHKHCQPLEERCAACNSYRWRLTKPARGPLRLLCAECWLPLERSLHEVISASEEIRQRWDRVIAFEAEVLTALRGQTPNQFHLNDTSGRQLLKQVGYVAELLCTNHLDDMPTNIALNLFTDPAMTPGRRCPNFRMVDGRCPLSVSSLAMRRTVLASLAAILDDKETLPNLPLDLQGPRAIDRFVAVVGRGELEQCLAHKGQWSRDFCNRLEAARQRWSLKRERMARRSRWSLPAVTGGKSIRQNLAEMELLGSSNRL